MTLFTFLAKV